MRLTELRQRLEELERDGYGQHTVEVSPAPPPVKNWHALSGEEAKRYRLNFVVMNYVVTSVSPNPMYDELPVMLTFTEAGQPSADSELEQADTFAFH